MLKLLLGWISGPVTAIGAKYIEGKNNANMKRLENEEQRSFIRGQLELAVLDDDYKRGAMVEAIIRNDRGDYKTSWIRPVTAVLALVFWLALTLSQIEWGGTGLLPITWNVPPGPLGKLFLAFPMGVLTSFFIARPFEKFLIGKTGVQ
jgi:hypothetical protein